MTKTLSLPPRTPAAPAPERGRPRAPVRPAAGAVGRRPPAPPLSERPARAAAPAPRPAPARNAAAGEGVRLNKRLAELGHCSRREADDWIARGWVKVNGQVAQMGQTVAATDRIEVAPQAAAQQGARVTILLHKPVGYVSGLPEDGHQSAAVLVQPGTRWREDRAPRRFEAGHTRGLAPAGRLDIDSTGLLVLTQDGRVAKALIGEDSGVEKEYLVRVHWAPHGPRGAGVVAQDVQSHCPPEALQRLRHGLSLDGQPLKPAQVDWQNPEQLRFVLREGKKRQIRRMCEQVGLHVVGLKRVRIGRVVLGNLPMGQWRYLGPHEAF
ncbi:pseudouridine synthase [Aquabacterium sp. A08]|uniref:pseudouridine synthase n=1 Tax=Aquabacterium sp. A08 TaxID=2718532 RepID=UPI00142030AF|nr:pseudouridine synthase [Aquabacterium sp. A08]NIC41636.1 rRNA pseudouridine synthase [Aquabacterium sp. A08]NIC41663.1 rRNA pseudouridine synthase [Aquabacterium sp. A08]